MQVLAELIISNESRIIESNSVSFYNRMRSFKFTATIRYQVQVYLCDLMQSTCILVHNGACCWIEHERPASCVLSSVQVAHRMRALLPLGRTVKKQAQLASECTAGAADTACRTLTSWMAS